MRCSARLSPGWRFALWGLVLARLLAPVVPAGPFSLFQLSLFASTWQVFDGWSEVPAPSPFESPGGVRADEGVQPADDRDSPTVEPSLEIVPVGDRGPRAATVASAPSPWTPMRIAGLIWLAGVLALWDRTARAAAGLRRRGRGWSVVDDPSVLELFDGCRRAMGVRQPVRLRATDDLGPAVTGLWRSCVLIPRKVLSSASRADLEHILLHELAHIRRRDVAVQWLLTVAGILHWFNPAVWLAAARMRADREFACDADVLRRLGRDRGAAYGNTVLSLAAGLEASRPRTALVGVLGTRRHLRERIVMIARHRPLGRGWGWLAAGILLALATIGWTDAANLGPIEISSDATAVVIAAVGDEPGKAAEPVPKPIADAITVLRTAEIRDVNRWGSAVRDLARIGKPAVPYLVAELDRTNSDRPMRGLAFALRAIGDPRAVPGLIRALARSKLVENSDGDYGFAVWNAGLLEFLQKHDLEPGARYFTVASGNAFHEVIGALHRLTGQHFQEDELHFVDREGSAKQRWLQRWVMHDLAARWAVWWKQNWRRFTDDPESGKVSLPPLPEAPAVAPVLADPPFPTGDRVRVEGGWPNASVGPPQALEYYRTFKDLDTGREAPWPKGLGEASAVKDDEVAAFAAREGFDLRGTEYTDPASGRSYYVIQGAGAPRLADRRRPLRHDRGRSDPRQSAEARPAGTRAAHGHRPQDGGLSPRGDGYVLARHARGGDLHPAIERPRDPAPRSGGLRPAGPRPPVAHGSVRTRQARPTPLDPRGLPRCPVYVQVHLCGRGRGPVGV